VARRLLVALAIALPPGVGLVAPFAFAFGAEAQPTISFTSAGTPPVVCGTHPDVRSLTVDIGTKIIIANLTEVAASVDVGKKGVLELAPGAGALVRLTSGQHELRLIPDCAVVTGTEAVVVTVQAPGQSPDQAPPPGDADDPVDTAGPDSPVTTATTSPIGPTGPAVGGSGAADPGAGGTTATAGPGDDPAGPMAPSGGAPGVTGSARSAAVDELNGSLESEVIDVRPIELGGSRDPKGVRLLAVIAAICVFGVTAAIIRAIVSQRTSDTVTL
jgi:hypothetical protein